MCHGSVPRCPQPAPAGRQPAGRRALGEGVGDARPTEHTAHRQRGMTTAAAILRAAGEVAEWLKATVLKTVGRKPRGFESHPLRQAAARMSPAADVQTVSTMIGPKRAMAHPLDLPLLVPDVDRHLLQALMRASTSEQRPVARARIVLRSADGAPTEHIAGGRRGARDRRAATAGHGGGLRGPHGRTPPGRPPTYLRADRDRLVALTMGPRIGAAWPLESRKQSRSGQSGCCGSMRSWWKHRADRVSAAE